MPITLRAKGYPPLLMRVGINTGEVVLRSIRKDDLHADYVPGRAFDQPGGAHGAVGHIPARLWSRPTPTA